MLIKGKYSYGEPEIMNYGLNDYKVIIGNFCSIAKNVKIYLANGIGHDSSFISTYPFGHIHNDIFNANNTSKNSNGDVNIGNDCWIGENAVLMSGITIGDGCIIANNSHVFKNFPPYSIIGGNPAVIIKKRFTDLQIEKLLEKKWWLWEDSKIQENIHIICSSNIDEFINLET
jgi:virginiamycin A acetyltransferase